MKKILNIFAVALMASVVPMLSACGDDDFTEKVSSVKVISANTTMPVMGGTSTVNVTGDGLSATSSASWLKVRVSGNSVVMVAESNTSIESRNALVTISASNGDVTRLSVSQVGVVILLNAKDNYVFEGTGNPDAIISNGSNVEFESVITGSWIKLVKNDTGYTLNVEDNDGNELRSGSITLKYGAFSKEIKLLQWGKEYPFTTMNTATFKDENGAEQTKAITIENNPGKEGQYLIKGLVPEGDVLLMPNTVDGKKEWYIPSGHAVGQITEGSSTLYLRTMMSCTNVNTQTAYYPTTITTAPTSAYRMTFSWGLNDEGNAVLSYFRNATLGPTYETDGIIVCKYNSKTSASRLNMKGVQYYFRNLVLSKK